MSMQAGATAARVIRFDATAFAQLQQQAQRAGLEECCGALVRGASGAIDRIIPMPNEAGDRRGAYVIPARRVFELERAVQVAGFYHSHPDGTSTPSPRDLELAWPGYIYVIAGSAVRAWRLNASAAVFDEIALVVEP